MAITASVKAWSWPSCSDSCSCRGSSRSCVPPPVRRTSARSFLPSCRSRNLRVGLCMTNRSEEHTSELQSRLHLVCRLLLEKKKKTIKNIVPRSEKHHTDLDRTGSPDYKRTTISPPE